jgi:hypothetical protein
MHRMRVLCLLCCAAAAVALAGCGGAADAGTGGTARVRATPPIRLGLVANTYGWGANVGVQETLAETTGVRWLREELLWSVIAPRRGERHWATIDRLFTAAAHRGIHLLPLLNDAPRWAAGRDGALPTDAAAYGDFVRDVVARYGPHGRFWAEHPNLDRRLAPTWFELWNEPFFARPTESRIDADRYAALGAAGLRGGRAADPDARFLLAAHSESPQRPGIDERWLDDLQAARPGLLAQADGIATHPYTGSADASIAALDHLTAALRARGITAPLWVTEVGWSTCDDYDKCVTEATQATDIRRFLTAVVGGHRADAVFLYHLLSWKVAPQDAYYGAFGLLRRNGSRKPSFAVFRRVVRAVAAGARAG